MMMSYLDCLLVLYTGVLYVVPGRPTIHRYNYTDVIPGLPTMYTQVQLHVVTGLPTIHRYDYMSYLDGLLYTGTTICHTWTAYYTQVRLYVIPGWPTLHSVGL